MLFDTDEDNCTGLWWKMSTFLQPNVKTKTFGLINCPLPEIWGSKANGPPPKIPPRRDCWFIVWSVCFAPFMCLKCSLHRAMWRKVITGVAGEGKYERGLQNNYMVNLEVQIYLSCLPTRPNWAMQSDQDMKSEEICLG
jgi:hypothetical protein